MESTIDRKLTYNSQLTHSLSSFRLLFELNAIKIIMVIIITFMFEFNRNNTNEHRQPNSCAAQYSFNPPASLRLTSQGKLCVFLWHFVSRERLQKRLSLFDAWKLSNLLQLAFDWSTHNALFTLVPLLYVLHTKAKSKCRIGETSWAKHKCSLQIEFPFLFTFRNARWIDRCLSSSSPFVIILENAILCCNCDCYYWFTLYILPRVFVYEWTMHIA